MMFLLSDFLLFCFPFFIFIQVPGLPSSLKVIPRYLYAFILSEFTGVQKFHGIEKDSIVFLSYQVNEVFCCTKGLYKMKNLREVLVSYIFGLIITLMLSRIFCEERMSISDEHNQKTFTKSSHASLLHYIENILNQSSKKCRDFLIVAALSVTKSTGICTVFIHYYSMVKMSRQAVKWPPKMGLLLPLKKYYHNLLATLLRFHCFEAFYNALIAAYFKTF